MESDDEDDEDDDDSEDDFSDDSYSERGWRILLEELKNSFFKIVSRNSCLLVLAVLSLFVSPPVCPSHSLFLGSGPRRRSSIARSYLA